METENGYPTFGEEDRSLFRIEDARSRADSMKERLVPRLEGLVEMSLELIREAYQLEPLDLSNMSIRPAHRKNASKTELFESSHENQKKVSGTNLEGWVINDLLQFPKSVPDTF